MKTSLSTLLLLLPFTLPTLSETSGCDTSSPTPTVTPSPSPTAPPTATPLPPAPEARPESTLGQLSALRFDAHTHPYNRVDGNLTYDQGVNLAAVVSNNNLAAVMSSVRMTVFNEIENGEAMRVMAQQYPAIVPVLWVHPAHGGSAETAEIYLRDYQFAGLKFHPAREELPADSPLIDPYVEVAVKYGVPLVIHTASDDPSWPERVGALAARHPNARIVLYHAGLSTDHNAAIDVVQNHPNTWLETSWVQYNDVLSAISQVGAERVLFGTDATTDGSTHYENNWTSGIGNGSYDAELIALGQGLSRADYRQVLVQNTARVFNLVTIHTYRPGASKVSIRFDNGSGNFGDAWAMEKEGTSWWRRTVPALKSVRFQVLVDGLDVDGTTAQTDAWEVWQKEGVLQTQVPDTTLRITYNTGYGHSIFVRGDRWPLSWTAGEPTSWSSGNVWTLTLTGVVEPLSFKALIDDSSWEQGSNHTVSPGETLSITPTF